MDDTIAKHLLTAILPPELVVYANAYVLSPSSPFQILKRHAVFQGERAFHALLPLFQPLVDRLLVVAAENQGILDALVPLTILILFAVVLNWIRRLVMWCTRLAMRAVFWATVFALGAWVWNRGLVVSARDAAVVGGKIAGYMAALKNVWLDEYDRYDGQRTSGQWGAQGQQEQWRAQGRTSGR